jgi:hypothetical protein
MLPLGYPKSAKIKVILTILVHLLRPTLNFKIKNKRFHKKMVILNKMTSKINKNLLKKLSLKT